MPEINNLNYFERVIDDYLLSWDLKNLSRKTIKSYDGYLKLLIKYLEEELKISNISQLKKEHIKDYIKFTKEKGKYSFVRDVNKLEINRPYNR